MRLLAVSIVFLVSSISTAETIDFNEAIKEATVSQNLLHRRLLRILQPKQTAIANNEAETVNSQLQPAAAEENNKIILN